MKENTFLSLNPQGFHNIYYTEWGKENYDEVLVCCHGMYRNCRDFDFLAAKLEDKFRVICPDFVGRGKSDWLGNNALYNEQQYLADATALVAHISEEKVHWLGTSMGGLVGLVLASFPNTPIKSLVLNDIGPFIGKDLIGKLGEWGAQYPKFKNLTHLEEFLEQNYAHIGINSDAAWKHMKTHSHHIHQDGSITLAFDPEIGKSMREPLQDMNFWNYWNAVTCPIMVLRGKESNVITDEVSEKMQKTKPGIKLVEFDNMGHCPSLLNEDVINVVRQWLGHKD